ncbi:phosphotransferase family protein [Microbacterium sp.]|uniref:phosphotransferase family protein n=1 Tax=Microbacterium sp. TaxID=51671 RepID=UPI003A8595B4
MDHITSIRNSTRREFVGYSCVTQPDWIRMATSLAMTTVPGFLRKRGLSNAAGPNWKVAQLTGGVSGIVFSADDGQRAFVVKQSLDRLAVEDEWTAPRERILNEARVLDLIAGVVPAHSPQLIDVDDATLTLTMEQAPSGWSDWKSELLSGEVDTTLASDLGKVLGTIHSATAKGDWSLPPDDGIAGFNALRIEPFHRTVAARLPEHAGQILSIAARVLSRATCLVHGDFSPKNILIAPRATGSRRFWLIDDEVGHRGDPVFDLAFFLSHLALKRIRAIAAIRPCFDEAGASFLRGYRSTGMDVDSDDLSEQIGCLVLARVLGRSQVGYLDETERRHALTVGAGLLSAAGAYSLDRPLTIA